MDPGAATARARWLRRQLTTASLAICRTLFTSFHIRATAYLNLSHPSFRRVLLIPHRPGRQITVRNGERGRTVNRRRQGQGQG